MLVLACKDKKKEASRQVNFYFRGTDVLATQDMEFIC